MKKQPDKKLIKEIAELIDCGMVCFLNPDTLELVYMPQGMFDGTFDADTGPFEEDLERMDTEWERNIRIEPTESFESFRIMEQFIDEVDNRHLKNNLQNALEGKKPFRNFKNIVECSDYRQNWFDFKQKCLEEHVTGELAYSDTKGPE